MKQYGSSVYTVLQVLCNIYIDIPKYLDIEVKWLTAIQHIEFVRR
jgi:hypothetical protein